MADPERDVIVLVGDGSYLMMAQDMISSIQEGYKLNIVVVDNHGFGSIGGLSESVGNERFGTEYRYRDEASGFLKGDNLPVDLAANAESLGAHVIRPEGRDGLIKALTEAREIERTTVIVIEADRENMVPSYESWWDVPIAEVSEVEAVQKARKEYEEAREKERYFL